MLFCTLVLLEFCLQRSKLIILLETTDFVPYSVKCKGVTYSLPEVCLRIGQN